MTCLLTFTAVGFTYAVRTDAAPITLSTCYTGACDELTGSVRVTISDDVADENNGTGDVKIVIDNLTNGFIDELGLMYQGTLPQSTALEQFTASGSAAAPTLSFAQCQNDNSDETLNICFDFMNKKSSRFKAGTSVTFFLDSTTTPLWATSLMGSGAYAHIQGLPADGSVKVIDDPALGGGGPASVPEPTTLVLLATGGIVFAIRERRRREQTVPVPARSEAGMLRRQPRR